MLSGETINISVRVVAGLVPRLHPAFSALQFAALMTITRLNLQIDDELYYRRPFPHNYYHGLVWGAPWVASFRMRSRPLASHLVVRMEKEVVESLRCCDCRYCGICIDRGQRLLLCHPFGVLFHFISADQVERQGETKVGRGLQRRYT